MSLKDTAIGVVLVGLVVFAMLTFTYQYQRDNGSGLTIINETIFSRFNASLGGNLSEVYGTVNTSKDAFEQGEPVAGGGDDAFGLTSIFAVTKNFVSMMFSTLNVIGTMASDLFGIPKIVLSVFSAIMMITMVILIWRVIKAGGT